VLGPVDPQVGEHPAASILKVIAKKPIAEIDDETLILADVAEKAIAQLRETVKELLTRSQSADQSRSWPGSSRRGPGRTTIRSRSRKPGGSG